MKRNDFVFIVIYSMMISYLIINLFYLLFFNRYGIFQNSIIEKNGNYIFLLIITIIGIIYFAGLILGKYFREISINKIIDEQIDLGKVIAERNIEMIKFLKERELYEEFKELMKLEDKTEAE